MIKKKESSIRVSDSLKTKLKSIGEMGECYEDVIWKLIKRKTSVKVEVQKK